MLPNSPGDRLRTIVASLLAGLTTLGCGRLGFEELRLTARGSDGGTPANDEQRNVDDRSGTSGGSFDASVRDVPMTPSTTGTLGGPGVEGPANDGRADGAAPSQPDETTSAEPGNDSESASGDAGDGSSPNGTGGSAGVGNSPNGTGGSTGTGASSGQEDAGNSAGTSAAGGSASAADAGPNSANCVPDAYCTCGTYAESTYRFCPVEATFSDALADCEAVGMTLVRVNDQAENNWLLDEFTSRGLFLTTSQPLVFLGGSEVAVEGEWRWTDGEVFWNESEGAILYENWWPFFPRMGTQVHCAGMLEDGTWVDRVCTSSAVTYACESTWW